MLALCARDSFGGRVGVVCGVVVVRGKLELLGSAQTLPRIIIREYSEPQTNCK